MKFATQRRPGLTRSVQLRWILGIFVGGVVVLAVKLGQQVAPPVAEDPIDFRVRTVEAPPPGALLVETDLDGDRTIVERFADVEDNTLGLSRAEFELVAELLNDLSERDASEVAKAARRDVGFSVLMRQPELFRGHFVHLEGQLQRLQPAAGLGGYGGPEELLEGWLFTADSGNNPFRILALAADAELPRADELGGRAVVVDGLFFKRFGYPSVGGQHVAPMMLAKQIAAKPQAVPDAVRDRRWPAVLIGLAIAAMAAVVVVLSVRQRRRPIAFRVGKGERAPANFDDLDGETPGEFLSNLSLPEEPHDSEESHPTN